MTTKKIIVARQGGIERHVIRVRAGGHITSALIRYGTALRSAYSDIIGLSHTRGYMWVGHADNSVAASTRPDIGAWIDMTRAAEDVSTWGTL